MKYLERNENHNIKTCEMPMKQKSEGNCTQMIRAVFVRNSFKLETT